MIKRNKALESNGAKPPKATSTGTTIVGVVFKVK
jgi:20S proteasome subunit beta 2